MNKPLFAVRDIFPGDIIQTSNVGKCSETTLFEKGSARYGTSYLDRRHNYIEEKLAIGFYHLDSNGNVIGVCPTWNGDTEDPNKDEVLYAHGISLR